MTVDGDGEESSLIRAGSSRGDANDPDLVNDTAWRNTKTLRRKVLAAVVLALLLSSSGAYGMQVNVRSEISGRKRSARRRNPEKTKKRVGSSVDRTQTNQLLRSLSKLLKRVARPLKLHSILSTSHASANASREHNLDSNENTCANVVFGTHPV